MGVVSLPWHHAQSGKPADHAASETEVVCMGWAWKAWALEKYAPEITRRYIFSLLLILSIGLEVFICISCKNMKASL